MDWFHCNRCFRKDGAHFFVTNCGHIFCKRCVILEKCAVCGTACKYLALSDNLKPQEKMYFKNPVETALQYFSHISQVWSFQKKQTDLLIAFYKHRITKLEAAMQESQQTLTNQDKLNTPRPVGITSPSQSVAPRPISQHSSQVVSRSSSVESTPYRMAGFSDLGQGARGLQGRSTPRDSFTETPSPASTHSLSYRASSASSGQGVFSFRPSLNSGDSGHTRVFTPNNSDPGKALSQVVLLNFLNTISFTLDCEGQRQNRTTLGSLPGFQLPVLQNLYQQRQMGLARGREAWNTPG
ncbi:RING finger protein 212B isoform X3 [Ovis aries]|uniref:RING finger protein 212B isoform X3 n=1 Tax=Ovis aries TaxID=9940 RepID=UPI001C2E1F7E|nr:RING finger protein 212B isoform X3 [Ovis aries]